MTITPPVVADLAPFAYFGTLTVAGPDQELVLRGGGSKAGDLWQRCCFTWWHCLKGTVVLTRKDESWTVRPGRVGLSEPGMHARLTPGSREHFYTSALATAAFLAAQAPGCSVYAIGEAGLLNALYEAGITMNDVSPDYVVIGEAKSYTYDTITKAIRLVLGGARLIGTNPDTTGPTEGGLVPACGSLVAPVELATGRKAYYLGKPNPLMMRSALRRLGATREQSVIIGDRMDTDILAGIESDIDTVLVLTGVTAREDLPRFPYQPKHVAAGIAALMA
jgi:NagD protein